MQGNPSTRSLLVGAVALALSACQGGDAPGAAKGGSQRPDREWTDAARVEAIASKLQACSYEGDPVTVEPGQLGGEAPADCRSMVENIMGYTGLPSNFVVAAGPVPNALAVILLDREKVPRRVIAFNPDFIRATERATGGGKWGPTSIMAHEIGHHLSGHTITEGGSRPAIELEADKFSGFVLYKMGAALADATKAIDALASPTEQRTHPAKARRVAAIAEGWQEACRQGGGSDCASGAATAAATPPAASGPAQPQPAPPAPTGTPAAAPPPSPSPAAPDSGTIVAGNIDDGTGTPPPPPAQAHVRLPAPSDKLIPFKFGRFVVDETGRLDAGQVYAFDRKLYALAKDKGVELALLFVEDFHGMRPDDYAWAMMRQLRVGKLDLGNGGVFVVDPVRNQVGTALAPGVAKKLEFFDAAKMFGNWLGDGGWERGCNDQVNPRSCESYTGHLLDVIDRQLRNLDTKWEIRYTSIEDAIARSIADEERRAAARKAGKTPDDAQDMPGGSLVRFTATVTDAAPKTPPADPQTPADLAINRYTVTQGGWNAVLVKTPAGQETTLYMKPRTAALMPSGKLQAGKQYTFVGEIKSTGRFHTDQGVVQTNPGVWLFSYEAL